MISVGWGGLSFTAGHLGIVWHEEMKNSSGSFGLAASERGDERRRSPWHGRLQHIRRGCDLELFVAGCLSFLFVWSWPG